MRGIHWDEGNGRPVLASSLVLCDMKYFVVKRTFLLGSDTIVEKIDSLDVVR